MVWFYPTNQWTYSSCNKTGATNKNIWEITAEGNNVFSRSNAILGTLKTRPTSIEGILDIGVHVDYLSKDQICTSKK